MKILIPIVLGLQALTAAPVHLVNEAPEKITELGPGRWLIDFGRVAFGNLQVTPSAGAKGKIKVHFGEAMKQEQIDRTPPGTVRYAMVEATLDGGGSRNVAPRANGRNTQIQNSSHPPAILTPPEWGVVLPFRWVEIEGWPGELRPEHLTRRAAYAKTWDDNAAAFQCSDEMLNRVWDLCRYSIKATTFAGIYVDGDRERIPYEADAYLNQLSHYYADYDTQMARDTFDHLMQHGTWPSEWSYHMVFMAYAEWRQTGDVHWLASRYDSLKSKLLLDRVGTDDLVHSSAQHIKRDDIVDWPKDERDGYVLTECNTVVNAFYLRALKLMAEMGAAIGRDQDRAEFAGREAKAHAKFQEKFFDSERGLYRDGATTDHVSLHANLFPLAFGIVPEGNRSHVAEWLAGRGMKCSVYAAQYLLEGLFENGQTTAGIDLIVAAGDRSWRHMIESGTTITWEAWDQKYKPNQDWNHAWGAAPGNLIPRYVLGLQSHAPGWKQALVQPHPGSLTSASGKIPTPLGPVLVDWKCGKTFTLSLTLPKDMTARVELPAFEKSSGVFSNNRPVAAMLRDSRWVVDQPVSGRVALEVR